MQRKGAEGSRYSWSHWYNLSLAEAGATLRGSTWTKDGERQQAEQGFWSLYTLGLADTIELTSLELRLSVAELYRNTSLLEEANG